MTAAHRHHIWSQLCDAMLPPSHDQAVADRVSDIADRILDERGTAAAAKIADTLLKLHSDSRRLYVDTASRSLDRGDEVLRTAPRAYKEIA